jgi:hypothetical protein
MSERTSQVTVLGGSILETWGRLKTLVLLWSGAIQEIFLERCYIL